MGFTMPNWGELIHGLCGLAWTALIGHIAAMCGRFNVIDSPGLQQLLQDLGIDLRLSTHSFGNRANIAPTDTVPLIRQHVPDSQARDVADARWWLTPSWSKGVDQKYAMFNARSETLSASRAYRHPFKCQRGLVPMSSFIEWRNEAGSGGVTKQPWRISNAQRALAVAALWDVRVGPEEGGQSEGASVFGRRMQDAARGVRLGVTEMPAESNPS